MGEGVLRLYHAGTMLWVRIPERGVDPTFLKSIPGTSWDARLKAFAIQDKYLTQLLSNVYEQEDLAPYLPFYVHPSEDREDFPGEVTRIMDDLARVKAYRTGTSTESVPETLRRGELIPRPYQYQGARFIMEARRVILGLHMGHGKGLTVLTAMQLVRMERPESWTYAVVFCPASTKELVWRREVEKWTDFKPRVVEGDRIDRGFTYRMRADVYILNPELVHRDLPEITELVEGATFLVVDEASCLRNDSSKISKVIESLSRNVPYFVEMTGTPLENDIMELYRLVTILNPGVFRSEKEFRYQYMPRDDNGKWVTHGVQNLKELRRLTGPVLFQRSRDQLKGQLPDTIARLEPIRLSDEQREIYEKIRKEEWVKLEQYKAEGDTAKKYLIIKGGLAALTRMLQVCSGLENLGLTSTTNPKITRLLEMFDTDLQQDKALIFTQYKPMTKVIKAALAGVGVKGVILSGDENQRQRELAVDSFQTNPDTRAIIMTTAGGRGLNLTAASSVVLFNLIWNPQAMEQIIGRAIRFGNKAESVTVTSLIAEGTAEEKMLAMNAAKSALFDAVLGIGEPSEDIAADVTRHASNMFSQLLEMFE